jgi:hypothetical protein
VAAACRGVAAWCVAVAWRVAVAATCCVGADCGEAAAAELLLNKTTTLVL